MHLKSGETVTIKNGCVPLKYRGLVEEELAQIESLDQARFLLLIDVPGEKREAGFVETVPGQEVFFVSVYNSGNQLSRFVEEGEGQVAQVQILIELVWHKKTDTYRITKFYNGVIPPREPWEPDATEEDRIWWLSHAYIWGHKDSVLKLRHSWLNGKMVCLACGYRKASRLNSKRLGDTKVCPKCSRQHIQLEPREVPNWGKLNLPIKLQ